MDIKKRAEELISKWNENYGIYGDLSIETRKKLIEDIILEMNRVWSAGLEEGRDENEKWGFTHTKPIFNGG